jgi:nitrite reductase/ring-hydroxylating ferredoxin subunit
MPETAPPIGQVLCASSELIERGAAHVFDVLLWRQPARAFVLRYDGRAVGYMNRCAHVPAEMDWQPGQFLDSQQRWIVCAIHGATYDPLNGYCIMGPCRGQRLMPLSVSEHDGQVWWHPSADIQPLTFD